jgi:hypothetical protein
MYSNIFQNYYNQKNQGNAAPGGGGVRRSAGFQMNSIQPPIPNGPGVVNQSRIDPNSPFHFMLGNGMSLGSTRENIQRRNPFGGAFRDAISSNYFNPNGNGPTNNGSPFGFMQQSPQQFSPDMLRDQYREQYLGALREAAERRMQAQNQPFIGGGSQGFSGNSQISPPPGFLGMMQRY